MPDTCVRVDTLLSQPMLEAAVVVRVRADQPPTEAALILESMLEDARLHILEQWRKLK